MYNRSALAGTYQAGDPFLGGVIKGIGKVAGGFLTGGPLGAIGAGVGLIKGGRGGPPQPPAGGMPGVGWPGYPRIPLPGVPGAGQGRRVRRQPGEGKRRRMNYNNQKALRRALRRATGFARQNKAVKKAASEFAREFGPKRSSARRDLGRGHRHVR